MTTDPKDDPTRVACTFQNKRGRIGLEQLCTLDKARLVRGFGTIDSNDQSDVMTLLQRFSAF
jgi:mRNA-degrading endonuclease toxin of MazEF toxin-antitoxin module